MSRPPVPVKVGDTTHPSIKAFARSRGVSPNAVHDARNNGRNLAFVGLGRGIKKIVAGLPWPSRAALSRALGFNCPSTFHQALKRSGLDVEAFVARRMKRIGMTHDQLKAAHREQMRTLVRPGPRPKKRTPT